MRFNHYIYGATAALIALIGAASFSTAAEEKNTEKPMQMMADDGVALPQLVESAKTQADHEAIAKRFEAEAGKFDDLAARHEKLAKHYGYGHGAPPKGNAASLANHCKNIVKNLKASSQDAREMAQLHRELGKALAK